MKSVQILFLLVMAVFLGCKSQQETAQTTNDSEGNGEVVEKEPGIHFEKGDWASVLKAAKDQDKLIFLDAYASWCGPCKLMEKRVFPNERLGDFYNAHFINAKIDMERGEGVGLSEKYNVQAYPTLFFLDAEGTIVKRIVGYRSVGDLMDLAKEVAK